MLGCDWKSKMISSDIPSSKSPKPSNKLSVSIPTPVRAAGEISPASSSACSAYEYYLRLPELKKLWSSKDFQNWQNELLLKPALQGLELTFRFVSTVFSDPRPYTNQREWARRLESLATTQIQIIAALCEDEEEDGETRGAAPIVDLSSSNGVLARDGSAAEVWKIPGQAGAVVSRTSESSLLPRLAAWKKSEDVAERILFSVECEMRRCPYTLGLGEPNLNGKPSLDYDAVCKPNELLALKKSRHDNNIENYENQNLYTIHQILESWIRVSQELLKRIGDRIEAKRFGKASSDCYLLERIWKLLEQIEDLHLHMDPDDFLRLKNQLSISSVNETASFCFRSRALVEITRRSKNLKHKVPLILGVEADPTGGPRIQEAAMRLYSEKKIDRNGAVSDEFEKVHLLQAMQAIEAAMKRFFFAYKQVVLVVMGSLEANGNRVIMSRESGDSLSQIFLEPTYFPSLDAAKTFLGKRQ